MIAKLVVFFVHLVAHPAVRADDSGAWSYRELETSSSGEPFQVVSADLDGDGDFDLIVSWNKDDTVTWLENVDSFGGSWISHEVYAVDNVRYLAAVDIDGDGDIDVIVGAGSPNTGNAAVEWYENVDSIGGSWTRHYVVQNVGSVYGISVSDIDGDGDSDVAMAIRNVDTIAWIENLDSVGTSWTYHEVSTAVPSAWALITCDIDGDGDDDLVASSNDDQYFIAWYENVDSVGGSWSYREIYSNADGVRIMHAVDMDGDGDYDIVVQQESYDTVSWHENADGVGGSWVYHEVTTAADGVVDVFVADIDGDGDDDIAALMRDAGIVAWYENSDGAGASWIYHEVHIGGGQESMSVHAIDIDGNGQIDLAITLRNDGIVAWCESLRTASPSPMPTPNPTTTDSTSSSSVSVGNFATFVLNDYGGIWATGFSVLTVSLATARAARLHIR